MSTGLALVNPTPAEIDASVQRAQSDVLEAFAVLRDMIAVAVSSPERQRAIVELVDALVVTRRKLTPNEELVVDGMMGVVEVAKFFGVGKSSVYNLIASGELRIVKIQGRTLVPRRVAIAYAAAHLTQPRDGGGE